MNQVSTTLKAAAIGEKFRNECLNLDQLLASLDNDNAKIIKEKLHTGVDEYKQQGSINIVFVGQYSAGKSTIISGLTGRRDIHIDADIATDKTTTYSWNGIKITDTPGLFTDRSDHDDITYEAIDKADLLVFGLTYMLFDSITVANFKKLVYDKGYGWKMMLVVNKMSDEAGEESEKIINYKKSLAEALSPQSLADFPLCFIDAKDYCEGVDDGDGFLKEMSRFDTFTTALNEFIGKRASYSQLDTPIRVVLSVVDDAEKLLTPVDSVDNAYLEILTLLSRRVEQERDRLRTKVKSIQLEMAAAISAESNTLTEGIGTVSDEDFQQRNKKSEINVRQHYEKAEKAFQRVTESAIESIRIEIEGELQKALPQAFVARLEANNCTQEHTLRERKSADIVRSSVGWMKEIADKAGGQLLDQAARGTLKTAKEGFALRGMDVAGGNLYDAVKEIGKAVGYKFKPYQAVGIAKNIGNCARFIGPVFAVANVAAEGYVIMEERSRDKELLNARRNIQKQFEDVSVDLKTQIEGQLQEFEQQIYDDIQFSITLARRERETLISTTSENYKALVSIRQTLNSALTDIKDLVTPLF